MKKVLNFACICLILTLLFGCNGGSGNTSASDTSDKSTDNETYGEPKILDVETIASPYAGQLEGKALTPWDMTYSDGYLYIGAGDFDKNVCPDRFFRYNAAEGEWTSCGTCFDEQISRFCIIDGKLTVPGTDPTEGWEYGNYYVLGDRSFKKHREIGGAVHTFDLIEYDGKIFTGDGVVDGLHPVGCSKIGSGMFKRIKFYKDGAALDFSGNSIIRVYDFFVLNDSLYAMLTVDGQRSVYVYDDGKFVYHANVYSKIEIPTGEWYFPIRAKETVGDTLYFTTGYLYFTNDLKEYTKITADDTQRFTDIIMFEDSCYALGWRQKGKDSYENRVFELVGTKCRPVCAFTSSSPALSFTRSENVWYFGLGGSETGTVVSADAS